MRFLHAPRIWLVGAVFGAASVAIWAGAGCGGGATGGGNSFGSGGSGTGSQMTASGGGTFSGTGGFVHHGPYSDFPKKPVVVDMGLPGNIGTLFDNSAGTDTGGPCLSEPALDAMVPKNWTPLLFEWTPVGGQNVFELRLHIKDELNDLVVYTSKSSFKMDAAMWKTVASDVAGNDVEITLRGAVLSGGMLTMPPAVGAKGAIHLAPVEAPGSVVYWTSSNGTSFQGFTIGDAAPVNVLDPTIAGATSTGGTTVCVSCHTSSPDGNLVVYTRDSNDGTRAIDVRTIQGMPPAANVVSPSALALLGREKNAAPTLSLAHYSANDAVAISVFIDPTLTANRSELVWTDLHTPDASGWGILPRTGDGRMAGTPAWRHDGTAVAYTSAPSIGEGVIASGGDFDIFTVPYNNPAGGAATGLPGASDPTVAEFYPIYSPDDALLAFNRSSTQNSYNEPTAEVFVVPGDGGTATRLAANDPPMCTGLTSPGLTNSWSRWAPSGTVVGDKKYYWLVFSSKRHAPSNDGMGNLLPQLYVASIVTSVSGGKETLDKNYPALYVASQNPTQNNHTPAWDVFKVKQVPPR